MYSGDIYVVFTKAKSQGWLFKWLHKEISHCFVIKPNGKDFIVMDNSIGKLTVFTVTSSNDILSESYIIKVKQREMTSYVNFNTCVSFVKQIIGINNPFIVTPYQLFKRLS